jgi:hypothetical protein
MTFPLRQLVDFLFGQPWICPAALILVMRPKFRLLGNIGLVWYNSSVSSQRCRPPLMDVNVKSRDWNIFDLLRR